ncbi:hypothetical protein SAMN05216227_102035 [Pseudorhodobacter antarcticus]|uniref:Uncharacterized protein n=1 Tax=Pseudorhodobacter antarcticus TaxID=1077947 RepID=A0A1H8IIM8_9RHOB|nr:hypothetical protein [Pseudorhodobacter antarcticus]SEN67588.1 hypothetical protein SAMN05216227_102035 [Pseudorhodobacter antarcticus]
MADQPTTVTDKAAVAEVSGKFTNPLDIKFPFDDTGFTSMLRKEGARAVGRIGGDAVRLQVFLNTLRVLGEHAKVKIAAQVAQKAKDLERMEAENAKEAERHQAAQRVEIARLQATVAAAEARLLVIDVPAK